jgi:hypothetical protein
LAHKPSYHTHKDFFDSLIKDIGEDRTWADVVDPNTLQSTLDELKKEDSSSSSEDSSNRSSDDDISLRDKICESLHFWWIFCLLTSFLLG